MAQEATDICLRVVKGSNKSKFDSYSVRNSISHITLWDSRVHTFSDNLLKPAVYVNTPRFLICTVWSVPLV